MWASVLQPVIRAHGPLFLRQEPPELCLWDVPPPLPSPPRRSPPRKPFERLTTLPFRLLIGDTLFVHLRVSSSLTRVGTSNFNRTASRLSDSIHLHAGGDPGGQAETGTQHQEPQGAPSRREGPAGAYEGPARPGRSREGSALRATQYGPPRREAR